MKRIVKIFYVAIIAITTITQVSAQNNKLKSEAEDAMLRATKFMVEEVSYNGGYVWYYMPDFSRQWGEMEAYKTMIWLQHPGTVSMGSLFLDIFRITGDEYYYKAAEKAAAAIIWGQSHEGGWNYMIDFAGDRSFKQWYNTIGKNGWRLEEFQHYYGNSTFDDNITSDAARFLLKMYLEKLDPKYKPALDKAISFILKSQYPSGGWPQRFPLMYEYNKKGHPDYSSFYTFNDDVTWENIHFLIQCYETLGEERFLDPIMRGMNFYLISQDASGGWGQQLDMNLKAAGARTYEPAALLTQATFGNAKLLMKFYELTGDKKFLNRVPDAIKWLDDVKLPADKTDNGKNSHASYIEVGTNKPIYTHRKGSNVKYGYYYSDQNDKNLIAHSRRKRFINVDELKEEYEQLINMPSEEVVKDSPLIPQTFDHDSTPQKFYDLNRVNDTTIPAEEKVKEIISALDKQNRWLAKHAMISHPYIGEGQKQEPTDKYACTHVGDETDTSPYMDESDQEYISTEEYINNMNLLKNYVLSVTPKTK